MWGGWLLLLGILAGCAGVSTASKARRVQTQEEAGSVHFAVVSVGDFDEFVEDLQPVFDITPEMALDRVLRPGRVSSRDVLDSLSVRVEAGKGVDDKGKAGAGQTSAEVRRRTDIPELQSDPMSQYWAATALYQEVQLLSRYVRAAAIRRGYRPYIVRLQVALLPRAHHQPYDAYTTISFFWTKEGTTAPHTARAVEAPKVKNRGAKGAKPPTLGPQVLPLFVTDNLESSVASRSRTALRQISAAVGYASGGAGGSLGVDRQKGELEAATGLDLNSLLTVARVSDNTLRVRLGAMQQGSTDFAMVPRTHAITVLVMLPQNTPETLQIVARTTMVDAISGVELPARTKAQVDAKLEEVGKQYQLSVEKLQTLLDHAQRNEVVEFFKSAKDVRYVESLWLDLVSVPVGGQYSSTIVDLRPDRSAKPPPTDLPPADQSIHVEDNRKVCRVLLYDGRFLKRWKIHAFLYVKLPGKKEALELPALGVRVVDGRHVLLVFPSLHAKGLKPENVAVRLEHGDDEPADYDKAVYSLQPR